MLNRKSYIGLQIAQLVTGVVAPATEYDSVDACAFAFSTCKHLQRISQLNLVATARRRMFQNLKHTRMQQIATNDCKVAGRILYGWFLNKTIDPDEIFTVNGRNISATVGTNLLRGDFHKRNDGTPNFLLYFSHDGK